MEKRRKQCTDLKKIIIIMNLRASFKKMTDFYSMDPNLFPTKSSSHFSYITTKNSINGKGTFLRETT